MNTDALVIGAGTAGLTAATRLAQDGLRVLVVATGEGCLPLASGSVDVLGYAPGPVTSPVDALPGLLEANPEHPYRLTGAAGLERSVAWFLQVAAPLGYAGELTRNRWVPTVLGGLRPTALVPQTMAAADLSGGGAVLIAGIRGFRDLHPALLAENLCQAATAPTAAIRARSIELDWPGSAGDLVPFRLARRLEDAEIRRGLAAQLRSKLGDASAVGLPAVLGREHAAEVHADLERRLGVPVFEIPGLPPSLPGLRLFDCLRRALRSAGGRLILGSSALSATLARDAVSSVTITQASRPVEVSAGFYVLATGGFATGGIIRERDGALREPVFGLAVHGLAPGEPPFREEYLGEHPLDRVGLRTDGDGRPLGPAGAPHAANLYAAGAVLAGALPWREKSGEGLSLATGWHVAEAILAGRREKAA
ncbi:MAG: anaerobic glycerol-3-phosphate dehydrogenase subunit GlpB [Candidatus Dormibacteria bacterium]